MNIRRLVQNIIAGLAAVAVSFGGYVGVSAEVNNPNHNDTPGVHELRAGGGGGVGGGGVGTGTDRRWPVLATSFQKGVTKANTAGIGEMARLLNHYTNVFISPAAGVSTAGGMNSQTRGQLDTACKAALGRAANRMTDPAKKGNWDYSYVVGAAIMLQPARVAGKPRNTWYSYADSSFAPWAKSMFLSPEAMAGIQLFPGKTGSTHDSFRQGVGDLQVQDNRVVCVAINWEDFNPTKTTPPPANPSISTKAMGTEGLKEGDTKEVYDHLTAKIPGCTSIRATFYLYYTDPKDGHQEHGSLSKDVLCNGESDSPMFPPSKIDSEVKKGKPALRF